MCRSLPGVRNDANNPDRTLNTMSSLRFGFLLSGAMHVAVVAAFSQSSTQVIPPSEQQKPLTLQLSVFEPPQPAVESSVPPELPEPVVEQPDENIESPEEPLVQEKPAEPERPVVAAKPISKKPEPLPVEKPVEKKVAKRVEAKPQPVKPVPSEPIKVAAVVETTDKPRPVSTIVSTQEKQHYLAELRARIGRSKFYPKISRRRGEEGTVVVSFVIKKSGDLSDLSVVESSGHRRLDQAALKTLKRVSPFLPIPEGLKRDDWPISVPIAFSLRG